MTRNLLCEMHANKRELTTFPPKKKGSQLAFGLVTIKIMFFSPINYR